MSKKIIFAALAALASGFAVAGDAYTALDADKNGAISQAEAAALPGLADQWATLDADSSGELSVEEFAKFEATEMKAPESK
jgi:hypothetical protein